jgi:hypothetical protein
VKRSGVLALLILVSAGAAVAGAASSSGGTTPGATLKEEATYLNARNWRPYYALMSPRFRESCDYSTFVSRNVYVRNQIKSASIKMISTRIAGSRAYLSYTTIAPPLKPFVTHNDLFVRIAGRWYDDLDAVTTC